MLGRVQNILHRMFRETVRERDTYKNLIGCRPGSKRMKQRRWKTRTYVGARGDSVAVPDRRRLAVCS